MKARHIAGAAMAALVSIQVFAHSNHSHIDAQGAIQVAAKSVKQMTFRDFGFEVGKLDATWKNLSAEQFDVVSVEEGYFVVSAANQNSDKFIFYKIANNGQVLDVAGENRF